MLRHLTIVLIILPLILPGCERDITSSVDYNKPVSITLIVPRAGDRFAADQPLYIQWSSVNVEGMLRAELLNNDSSVYSVNNIPNAGNFVLKFPVDIIPSKRYQLKLEVMTEPQVFDKNKDYFEITPVIEGHWYYSNLSEASGLALELDLVSFGNDYFFGRGHFRFNYLQHDTTVNYEKTDTVGGSINYPVINIVLREPGNKEFDFSGKMSTGGRISGRLTGFIDSTYGFLNDTLTLVRQ